jgi:type IV secretion system protein VirB10
VSVSPDTDPRVSGRSGILPVVAISRPGLSGWWIAAIFAALGLLLFLVLDARRRSISAPAVRPRAADLQAVPAAPPPLYIPPVAPQTVVLSSLPTPTTAAPSPTPQIVRVQEPPRTVYVQTPAPTPAAPPQPVPTRATASGSALVIDTTSGSSPAEPNGSDQSASAPRQTAGASIAGTRAGAGVLANRATTVPQGTLIPAVLETALDSTRPGLARALVSRDIRGFDGTRALIPRGSRLIGEYGASAEAGQNRMLINWIRLVRPDGATIAIGSPASDPVGRAGVRASVNSHFFERFAGAILQSTLDVGVNLASRSVRSPVVVALPSALQGSGTQIAGSRDIAPTLKVKPATSISIFVARDLDFTRVENR